MRNLTALTSFIVSALSLTSLPASAASWMDSAEATVYESTGVTHDAFHEPEFGPGETSHPAPTDATFPKSIRPTTDPISGRVYQRVLYGPVVDASPFLNYTHRRYVTVYDVSLVENEIADLPRVHQSCFAGGRYPIGSWRVSRTIEVSCQLSAKGELLGIGAELRLASSVGRAFELQINITSEMGIEADYIPTFAQEQWKGVTFVQTYNADNGTLGYLTPAFWEKHTYPAPFAVTNAATTFKTKRVVLRNCPPGTAKPSAPPPELE